jgi:hypothetical protein
MPLAGNVYDAVAQPSSGRQTAQKSSMLKSAATVPEWRGGRSTRGAESQLSLSDAARYDLP